MQPIISKTCEPEKGVNFNLPTYLRQRLGFLCGKTYYAAQFSLKFAHRLAPAEGCLCRYTLGFTVPVLRPTSRVIMRMLDLAAMGRSWR